MAAPRGFSSLSMAGAMELEEHEIMLTPNDVLIDMNSNNHPARTKRSNASSTFYHSLVKNFAHHLLKQFHQVSGGQGTNIVNITAENMSIAAAQLVDIIEQQRHGRFIVSMQNKYRVLTRSEAVEKVAHDLLNGTKPNSTGGPGTGVTGVAVYSAPVQPPAMLPILQAPPMYDPHHQRYHHIPNLPSPQPTAAAMSAQAQVPTATHGYHHLYGTSAAAMNVNTAAAAMSNIIQPALTTSSASTSLFHFPQQQHQQTVPYYLQNQQKHLQQQFGTTAAAGGSALIDGRKHLQQQFGTTPDGGGSTLIDGRNRISTHDNSQLQRFEAPSSMSLHPNDQETSEIRHMKKKEASEEADPSIKSKKRKEKGNVSGGSISEKKKKKLKTDTNYTVGKTEYQDSKMTMIVAASRDQQQQNLNKVSLSKRAKQKYFSHIARMIFAVLRSYASGKPPLVAVQILDNPVLLKINRSKKPQHQTPLSRPDERPQLQHPKEQEQRTLEQTQKNMRSRNNDNTSTTDNIMQHLQETPHHQQASTDDDKHGQPRQLTKTSNDKESSNKVVSVQSQQTEIEKDGNNLATDDKTDDVIEIQQQETEKQRNMRLLLRHRFLAAASKNIPLIQFSKDLLRMWECYQYIDVATSIISRMEEKKKTLAMAKKSKQAKEGVPTKPKILTAKPKQAKEGIPTKLKTLTTKSNQQSKIPTEDKHQAISGPIPSLETVGDYTTTAAAVDTAFNDIKTPKKLPVVVKETSASRPVVVEGSWHLEERLVFLREWERNGVGDWGTLAKLIPTRSRTQISSLGRYILRKFKMKRGDKPTDELRAFFRRPSQPTCPALSPEDKVALAKALSTSESADGAVYTCHGDMDDIKVAGSMAKQDKMGATFISQPLEESIVCASTDIEGNIHSETNIDFDLFDSDLLDSDPLIATEKISAVATSTSPHANVEDKEKEKSSINQDYVALASRDISMMHLNAVAQDGLTFVDAYSTKHSIQVTDSNSPATMAYPLPRTGSSSIPVASKDISALPMHTIAQQGSNSKNSYSTKLPHQETDSNSPATIAHPLSVALSIHVPSKDISAIPMHTIAQQGSNSMNAYSTKLSNQETDIMAQAPITNLRALCVATSIPVASKDGTATPMHSTEVSNQETDSNAPAVSMAHPPPRNVTLSIPVASKDTSAIPIHTTAQQGSTSMNAYSTKLSNHDTDRNAPATMPLPPPLTASLSIPVVSEDITRASIQSIAQQASTSVNAYSTEASNQETDIIAQATITNLSALCADPSVSVASNGISTIPINAITLQEATFIDASSNALSIPVATEDIATTPGNAVAQQESASLDSSSRKH